MLRIERRSFELFVFCLGFVFEVLDLGRCKAMFLDKHGVGFPFQDRFLVHVG